MIEYPLSRIFRHGNKNIFLQKKKKRNLKARKTN